MSLPSGVVSPTFSDMIHLGYATVKRHAKRALPTSLWGYKPWGKGIVHEQDLRVGERGVLIKVLVMKNYSSSLAFGRSFVYGGDLKGATGWCLECVVEGDKGVEVMDKNYCCVLGFLWKELSVELVAHEAIHAALAWGRRTRFAHAWTGADETQEEHIAWPAGLITGEIWAGLVAAKLV